MKNLLTILFLLLVASSQTPRPTMALRHVTLVDVTDGSLRPNHTVLVTGNRITVVGPSDRIRTQDGAKLVDGAGGFLIPGLCGTCTSTLSPT